MSAPPRRGGSAFGAVRRALAAEAPCPCGGARYGTCCAPKLAGAVHARTAEELMRSRFTAFALGDRRYLDETWHPSTRPVGRDLEESIVWESLTIEQVVDGGPADSRGIIEFCARWRDVDSHERGEMRERSRFVRQRDRWWYVAGE